MPPLVDLQMTLDSGLRRNNVQGIMLCPDIFEHSLSAAAINQVGNLTYLLPVVICRDF